MKKFYLFIKKIKPKLLIVATLLLNANCLLPNISFAQTHQLWSAAANGGAYNLGAFFKMNLDGSGYVHYDFYGANGTHPTTFLMQTSDGTLYGLATTGGQYNSGVLLKFDASSQ